MRNWIVISELALLISWDILSIETCLLGGRSQDMFRDSVDLKEEIRTDTFMVVEVFSHQGQ